MDPGRGPGHLFADGFCVGYLWGFDDHLIVDMAADVIAAEGVHGVGEDVAGDRLDDVFHDLGTEGLNTVSPLPPAPGMINSKRQ